MKLLPMTFLFPLTCALVDGARAQDDTGKPRPVLAVEPDAQSVTANKLHGRWKLDAELTKRLGGTQEVTTLEFVRDDKIVPGLPDQIVAKLARLKILAAGTMRLRDQSYPFLLVTLNGNTQVVYFRARGGNPVGDAESAIVTVASAADRQMDLLFVGGDFANEPFKAFTRDEAKAGVDTIEGVLADMIRLLEAKKHAEFVKTYMAPADQRRLAEKEAGESQEAIIEQFGAKKGPRLLERLRALAGTKPTLATNGKEATFPGEGAERGVTLVREGERWYLKN